MNDLSLSSVEWIILGGTALILVAFPEWLKSVRSRRKAIAAGYRPQSEGIKARAVLLSLLPVAGTVFVWFGASGYLLFQFSHLMPPKVMSGAWWMAGILDVGVLALALSKFLPPAYYAYMNNKPRGVNTPLDWLVGLLLTIIFVPGLIFHVAFVAGIEAE